MKDIFLSMLQWFVELWWSIMGKKRDEDDSSVVGQSPIEKEGPGFVWFLIGGTALALVAAGVFLLVSLAT